IFQPIGFASFAGQTKKPAQYELAQSLLNLVTKLEINKVLTFNFGLTTNIIVDAGSLTYLRT
ncbi:hypothetical protein, partial [Pseudoalteromonas sp.]|uniref:hypothetical protein n=1 Tax=Pseudoalteromonas sp. TaxID=53249 RepID=UPI003F9B279F